MTGGLFLVKYGEIALKKGNRASFVKMLKNSIRARLPERSRSVYEAWHRIYIPFLPEDRELIAAVLSHTFGIVSFCKALRAPKDMAAIVEAACALAGEFIRGGLGMRFKAEVRRADKSFPMSSYQIACALGDALLSRYPQLTVDVRNPDWVLYAEIREHAYLYGPQTSGPSGLPLGSSGKGLLLLSGGIDSPVAGYLMAKRGLALEAVYFHSAPFTSEQAREKVIALARILSSWLPDMMLHIVPFTAFATRIKQRAHEEQVTLLMRAGMMRIADRIARRRGGSCLVTGESLGQVASQTVESIDFTGGFADLPVFRPLIGFNKEEIVTLARRIETFETSRLPYDDCCVLFSPAHPLIHPLRERMRNAYEDIGLDEVLNDALEGTETLKP